jgi:dephospho-CoA kinase
VTLRTFGLTGGIGSGKSTVARRLLIRGLPVVDADVLAREAVQPGSAALLQIVSAFGNGVLNGVDELDRARLGAIVFADAHERQKLDAIVHPVVRCLASERFAQLALTGEPLACYEVPLLYEAGLERIYSPVLVVNAPEGLRRARLAARDQLDEPRILARIKAQMPLSEKVRRADYVVENDDSLTLLLERTDAAFDAVCSALGVDPSRYPKPEFPAAGAGAIS